MILHVIETRATLHAMESKLANEAKLAVIAATQRLTPEQRLNAFLTHCQLMMELRKAGTQLRSTAEQARA